MENLDPTLSFAQAPSTDEADTGMNAASPAPALLPYTQESALWFLCNGLAPDVAIFYKRATSLAHLDAEDAMTRTHSPYADAVAFLATKNNSYSLFSVPLFGRSFFVTLPTTVRNFLLQPSRATYPPECAAIHEHYGIPNRPFRFFVSVNATTIPLSVVTPENIRVARKLLHDLLEAHVAYQLPEEADVYIAMSKTRDRPIRIDFLCNGFHVSSLAEADACLADVHRGWDTPFSIALERSFAKPGSLLVPLAALVQNPEGRKLPLEQDPLDDSRMLAWSRGLLSRVTGMPSYTGPGVPPPIHLEYVLREQCHEEISQALWSMGFIFLPNSISAVLEGFPPSLFAPSLLPCIAFIRMRIRSLACPFARIIHEDTTLTFVVTPGSLTLRCYDPNCIHRPDRRIAITAENREGYTALQMVFFSAARATEELSARHVTLPRAERLVYLTRLAHRGENGVLTQLFHETPLKRVYSNIYYFNGVEPRPVAERLHEIAHAGIRMASATYFQPIPLATLLAQKEAAPLEVSNGRVNLFTGPPLLDEKGDSVAAEALHEAFVALFRPEELLIFYCFLAYLVKYGRPRMALCLVGPEGCGKSSILNVLLTWFAPHTLTFTQESHIAQDRFNSTLAGTTVVFFDDCDDLPRNFLYDLITTDTPHGIRRLHEEWSAAEFHTTVFLAYNPCKNPLPLEFAHQRRFLLLEILAKKHATTFWEVFRENATPAASRAFIEEYLLPFPSGKSEAFRIANKLPVPDAFVLGEAPNTPTLLRERGRSNSLVAFVGDVLASKTFPMRRGPGRPPVIGEHEHEHEMENFFPLSAKEVKNGIEFPAQSGTWWLGFKQAYEGRYGEKIGDLRAFRLFLLEIFKPVFMAGSTHIDPWRLCVARYQADFQHDELNKAFPQS